VTDDPHKIEEINQDASRERVLEWWDQTMNTRLNHQRLSVRVIVMQRLHEADLCGHLLEKNSGYVHLCLPMEYEGKKYFSPVKWTNPFTGQREQYQDPRKEPGELLFPSRFGPKEVAELKLDLDDYGYASKYQQVPVPKGGAMFSRAWFQIVENSPIEIKKCIRYWDKAGTFGKGAYTVGVRMVITHSNMVFIEDVVRAQLDDLGREQLIKNTAIMDRNIRPQTEIWIEQEPGSGGKDAAAATIRSLAGFKVYSERPTGDKITRAGPLAAYSKAGNVKLVKADWNEQFLREFEFFPRGKYKDQVDASSGAYSKLFRGGLAYNI
jgi:predicted phage terminase large subunit-like protein